MDGRYGDSMCGPPAPPAELDQDFDPNTTFYDHETEGFYPTHSSTMCGTDPNRITFIEPYSYECSDTFDSEEENCQEDDEEMRIRMWKNMNFSPQRSPGSCARPHFSDASLPPSPIKSCGVGYSSDFSSHSSFGRGGGSGLASPLFRAASPPVSPIKMSGGGGTSGLSSPLFSAASPPPSPIKMSGGGGASFFTSASPPPSPIQSSKNSGSEYYGSSPTSSYMARPRGTGSPQRNSMGRDRQC